jgi:hypothetical protein
MSNFVKMSKIETDSNGLSKDTCYWQSMYSTALRSEDEIVNFCKEDFVRQLHRNGCNVTEHDIYIQVDYVEHTSTFVLLIKYIPRKSLVNSLERDTVCSKSLEPIQYTSDGSERYRYAGINPRLNVCVYVLDKD